MPLHVETNPPATDDDLDRIESALGAPLPGVLRTFLRRHDGAQTFAEDGALGWIIHGTEGARILRDGALARSPDATEFLGYARDAYARDAPLLAETASYRDWAGASVPGETGPPWAHVCVAAHWGHHGSCWMRHERAETRLVYVPSTRLAHPRDTGEIALATAIDFEDFVTRLLAGDEPL